MDLSIHKRLDGDIDGWANRKSHALAAIGIQVIECSDLIQEHASTIILTIEGFAQFCQSTEQRVAFLYRGACNITELIQSTIQETCEKDEDLEPLIRIFNSENGELVEQAERVCPTHFYAEFTLSYQGSFVASGAVSETYEDLLQALELFCDSAEDRREEAREKQLEADAEFLDKIADELMKDLAFTALRGKRKRCVYVYDKYGPRLPRHPRGELRRIDQNSNPMDANLVNLVERVSDRLEFLNQLQ